MDSREQAGPSAGDRVDHILTRLRERGMRVTPQRVAIVQRFIVRGDHPSAESLYKDLRDDFPMMAISTVYKTLRTLVDLGEAVEVSPAAPEARYDPNTRNHYHLVCLGCKAIVDVAMEAPPHTMPSGVEGVSAGFRPLVHVYQIIGYCSSCVSAGRSRAPEA